MAIGASGFVVIWTLVSVLAATTICSADTIIPKPGEAHCTNFIPWLRAVAAGDAFTELVITLLPMIGLYDTLLATKSKVVVMLAFSTRTP